MLFTKLVILKCFFCEEESIFGNRRGLPINVRDIFKSQSDCSVRYCTSVPFAASILWLTIRAHFAPGSNRRGRFRLLSISSFCFFLPCVAEPFPDLMFFFGNSLHPGRTKLFRVASYLVSFFFLFFSWKSFFMYLVTAGSAMYEAWEGGGMVSDSVGW